MSVSTSRTIVGVFLGKHNERASVTLKVYPLDTVHHWMEWTEWRLPLNLWHDTYLDVDTVRPYLQSLFGQGFG